MHGTGFKTIHYPSHLYTHMSLHLPLPTPFTYTPSPTPLTYTPSLHLYSHAYPPLTYTLHLHPSPTHPLPLTTAGIASPKLEVIKFVYPQHGIVFGPGVMRNKQLGITRQDLHQGRARTRAWYMGHCVSTQRRLQRIQVSIDLEEATG